VRVCGAHLRGGDLGRKEISTHSAKCTNFETKKKGEGSSDLLIRIVAGSPACYQVSLSIPGGPSISVCFQHFTDIHV